MDNQPSHPPEGVYIVASAGKMCVEPVNGQMTTVVNPIIWALRIYMVTFVFLVAEDGFPVIITAANNPVRFPVFGEPLCFVNFMQIVVNILFPVIFKNQGGMGYKIHMFINFK